MSPLKHASMFVLSLIMFGGETVLTVGQAYAHCCGITAPSCSHKRWSQMFYGDIEKINSKGNKFRLINKDGVSYEVRANENVVAAFKEENIKTFHGIGIIGNEGKEPILIGLVAGNDHGQGNSSESEILAFQQEMFAKGTQKP